MKKLIVSVAVLFALSASAGVMAQDAKTAPKKEKAKTECCTNKDNKKACCDKTKDSKACCDKTKDSKACCDKKTTSADKKKTETKK